MMIVALLFGLAVQAAAPVTLPATPQGKQVEAFVKALRTGEDAFVAFQGEHMLPARPVEQRKKMYARIHQEFGDFTLLSVLSGSAEQVSVAVKHPQGMNASFTFSFEKAAPYRITDMNVQVTP
jgi:hypothetical protein